MRIDAILKRLLELHPNKLIDLKLNRIERLLNELGNPQDNLPKTIHVAGTNGKGSTIAFLRAMLEAAGKTVHVYTSPHLVRFNERIRLSGELVSDKKLLEALEICEKVNAGRAITYFEITTAAAFYLFSKEKADYLLLEVGLGGRFDATNVVDNPLGVIITPVSIDHQEFLGENLQKIAFEKAGVLKANSLAVIARQQDEAMASIQTEAKKLAIKPFVMGRDFDGYQQNSRLIYQDENGLLDLPPPSLKGNFQYENASTAIAAITHFNLPVNENQIEKGLRNTVWAGRFMPIIEGELRELLTPNHQLFLDGGHNVAGAKAISSTLNGLNDNRPIILIMAAFANKDVVGFLEQFKGRVNNIFTIEMKTDRKIFSAEKLAQLAQEQGFKAFAAKSIKAALTKAAKIDDAIIVICGSLHLVGDVLAQNKTPPN